MAILGFNLCTLQVWARERAPSSGRTKYAERIGSQLCYEFEM